MKDIYAPEWFGVYEPTTNPFSLHDLVCLRSVQRVVSVANAISLELYQPRFFPLSQSIPTIFQESRLETVPFTWTDYDGSSWVKLQIVQEAIASNNPEVMLYRIYRVVVGSEHSSAWNSSAKCSEQTQGHEQHMKNSRSLSSVRTAHAISSECSPQHEEGKEMKAELK